MTGGESPQWRMALGCSFAIFTPSAISLEQTAAITPTGEANLDPVSIYLSQLSISPRRTMRGALKTIATLVSAGELDAISFPWAELRYQHTQAIYVQLSDRYASSTTNKMMAALSRVLEEAWKLGLMSAEDYHPCDRHRTQNWAKVIDW